MSELPPEALLQARRPRPLLWALCWVGFYLFLTAAQYVCDWLPYTNGHSLQGLAGTMQSVALVVEIIRVVLFGAGLALATPILVMRVFRAESMAKVVICLTWLVPLVLLLAGWIPLEGLRSFHTYAVVRTAARDLQPVANAVRHFRKARGRLPASLGELVPDYLGSLPTPSMRAARDYRYYLDLWGGGARDWHLLMHIPDRHCSGGNWRVRYDEPGLARERAHRSKDGVEAGWTFKCK